MSAGLHGERQGNGTAHLQRPHLRRAGKRESLQGRGDQATGLGSPGGRGIGLDIRSFGRRFLHLHQEIFCNLLVLGVAAAQCFFAAGGVAFHVN